MKRVAIAVGSMLALAGTSFRIQAQPIISSELGVFSIVMLTGGCVTGRQSMRDDRSRKSFDDDYDYCIKYSQSQRVWSQLTQSQKEKFAEMVEEQKKVIYAAWQQHIQNR